MRQDDRGITLVEIIIAIAASTVVILAASIFIRNALQGYGLASDAIDLQIEAQVLMEQFATWAMEGNYALYEEYEEPDVDVLIIYNIPRKAPDSDIQDLLGERWMRVFWRDGRRLYMYKLQDDNTFDDPMPKGSNLDISAIMYDKENQHLLSNYVEDFKASVEWDSSGLPYKVTVTLSMRAGIQRYEFRDEINIRNASYVPAMSPQPSTGP